MSAFRHPAQAYGYGPLSPAHGAFAQPGYGYAGYGYTLEQATKLREAEQKQYEEYVAAEKKAYEDACAKEKEYYEKERALAEKLGAYHAAHPYGYPAAYGAAAYAGRGAYAGYGYGAGAYGYGYPGAYGAAAYGYGRY